MRIAIIGGGAAGMMAAITAGKSADVVLFEKNEKLGKKVYITGKGRCNVTNDCSPEDFLQNVVHGGKFLRSAIYSFPPSAMIEFLQGKGLALVTERGNRVFPLSNKSSDVIKTLARALDENGVDVRLNTPVKEIRFDGEKFLVLTTWERLQFDKVIIATGGLGYPSTGSTGDGNIFARNFGHDVVPQTSALAPILTVEDVKPLEGLSLKNVTLTAYNENGKEVYGDFGEMLFTARGVSGPIALSASSYITRLQKTRFCIDLKPALDEGKLEARILRDFDERKNMDIKNAIRALMPERLNTYVLSVCNIPEYKKVNAITKEERARLVRTIKALPFTVKKLAPFEEAIITSGGIDTKQLTPYMESKLQSGLYFIGETIDVDALTGGYNLQIAFATGVAAGNHAIKSR